MACRLEFKNSTAVAWWGRKEKSKSRALLGPSTSLGIKMRHPQRQRHLHGRKEFLKFGGAEGIRTLDLLDAIEARSQLRHGPTGNYKGSLTLGCGRRPERRSVRNPRWNGEMSGFTGDE